MNEIFLSVNIAIGAYRRAVNKLIPRLTRVGWQMKKRLLMNDAAASPCMPLYGKPEWGDKRDRPGAMDKTLASVLHVIPKIDKLKAFTLKLPNAETARWFEASFSTTLNDYRKLLLQSSCNTIVLVNRDFDTGRLALAGE